VADDVPGPEVGAEGRSAELLRLHELNRVARAVDMELADLVAGAP
jgi:hypothetical protein